MTNLHCIFALLFLILTIVFAILEYTHGMCFMGILALWYLTESHHSDIIDKMKGE